MSSTKDNKILAEEIISDLKSRFGVGTDVELAEKLGIDPATVSAWRTRGSVPSKYQLKFISSASRLMLMRSVDETVETAEKDRRARKYVFSLVGRAAQCLQGKATFRNSEDEIAWLGIRLARVYDYAVSQYRELPLSEIERDDGFELHRQLSESLEGPRAFFWIEELPDLRVG